MTNSPLLLVILSAAGCYIGKLWWDDARAARAGSPNPRALPGACFPGGMAVTIAIAGALALLAIETLGESALGLSAQQSRMTGLFALYSLSAAIVEEVIFRGYLVVERRGSALLWASAVGASLVFAALHPFLWRWDDHGFALTLGAKGAFSSAIVFATSLWLYGARFAPWNRNRSLLPCIAGHAAKNAGVIAIKAAQGFFGGAW